MSSPVAELDAGLQAMVSLKAPGVSGSRINSLTALCVANVQSESVLVQKLFLHFKKTPGTHKLGVLYVVDSVTRKWMDLAKTQGQAISQAAQDGTAAAGVHRVTELMPALMTEIISTAPEEQKDKIRNLIKIWERGQTFPPSMIESFKNKLDGTRPDESTTPPVTAQQPPAIPNNIMEALASIARQNATAAQSNPSLAAPAPVSAHPPPAPAPVYNGALSSHSNGLLPGAPMTMPSQPSMSYLPTSQPAVPPVNFPTLPLGYAQPAQPPPPVQVPAPAGQPNPLAVSNPTVQLVAALAAQGLPIDRIASVIQMMGQGAAATAPQAPLLPQLPQPAQTGYAVPAAVPAQGPGPAPWEMSRQDEARDRNGYRDPLRSPGRVRGRSRSRSPPRGWDVRGSPRTTRGSDRGFDYGRPPSPGRGRPDERDRRNGGGGGRMPDYRQRSPPGRREHSTPDHEPVPGKKWVEFDKSIEPGCIKVYSRTLFVGGVTCSESELRQIFSRYGQVQTCIVNKDKRHAFVKMYFRKDAEAAKAAMEENRTPDLQLRTRWGVGFGPRDCSNYQTGVSIIPIHKLTEADRKWMLTAPFGGSDGQPIVHGLSVEEPDIEIGAGVSSKAISRRMQTDKGGNHGPKSTKRDDEPGFPNGPEPPRGGGGGGRWRHGRDKRNGGGGGDRGRDDRNDKSANDEPVVLGLPDGITMGRNGINYNPNFAFGGAGQ
ncbi:Rpb7-binding protein seb1 [Echria macrotheca]|uniref:Rpb7-binding protein seb1 n=1 Tax=Echria macrotheca TaxID=438768 RepID=A0AAJ0BA93_9PEZI|nr:Rpb7-binding protein seb1 [Echria macrotheca]